ncbi:helicase associated domain-containing protein, partial [Streptomyces sp. NPDC005890]|uniref:helicase associated domain-containing protein n=1 Tax=Streptomyces sp. NPDC005890 TaxID=3154568 RepID=UPI0033F94DE3
MTAGTGRPSCTPGRPGAAGRPQDQEQQIKLGAWISNQRSRAAGLTPERVEQL